MSLHQLQRLGDIANLSGFDQTLGVTGKPLALSFKKFIQINSLRISLDLKNQNLTNFHQNSALKTLIHKGGLSPLGVSC
jgi:hypothetical protein